MGTILCPRGGLIDVGHNVPTLRFEAFYFHPLSAASIRRERAVGLGEHCLSTWPRSGSCELRSPARLRLIEGTPEGGGKPGRRFFDYFL
jgi:hypothetical protein